MTQKIDIALGKDNNGIYDISVGDDGDLSACYGFETALLMSLLCERRADKSEVPDVLRRRGWIGNQASSTPGFEIGSKLWLYEQARITNSVLNGIRRAALDSVEWLVEDALATGADATIVKDSQDSAALLVIVEASSGKVEQRYFKLWEITGR